MYNERYYAYHSDKENTDYAFDKFLKGKYYEMMSDDLEKIECLRTSDHEYYMFPKEIRKGFDKAIAEENVFRRIANLEKSDVATGNIIVTTSDAEAQLVPEKGRIRDDDDTMEELPFGSYKLGSICKMRESFVFDRGYDVKRYLQKEFARRFGITEEYLCVNGSGKGEPRGLLNYAQTGKVVSGDTFTVDDLIELYFSVDKRYRKKGTWLMNDETAMELRKMKNGSGDYILKENNTIFGRPVEICNSMTDSSKPIAFGDFSYYYMILRDELAVKVLSELYINDNKVGYIGIERFDARLTKPEAVKLLVLGK